ncbi:2-succinyl-5-enolpyruvyl-6-hydroxy-3-cyclohexene-1-carboxylic-acid synthase [Flavobacteriaceae bacterium]|jgi:2-succinyl-5-enolpyruvyl-6-hydroxy-3-cyclohexene-1-carboxylate synthase|nr:2-succinyl-5-enolpyruvyl-6-hydroxy-3-cyclohexene-1-carboxylic-acid synthase [Flavobacteriaceae bacterium]MDC1310722.1 2-succinyl-5-enolpyruvyl-6-hydroxy-3-cyclohexene-1-carboxylic-acid synthase [Flavobacteriaceae bacterium]MDC1321307.1 2-succinyl-5-enolpyruvyl-6-hydroxy-3-cyclohexene-1-carboxylic-acid synthase [Flavobacteriaceae bacterium]|tara:strand:+ start:305 stop:1987 length:1683 start_codon:yes stop_codon:yes gene_type:complete
MKFSKNILAQSIIDLCFKKNIKNIVISPGSRNAPLTLGFNHNSFFKTYNIVDERSAAFFALGIAQQINFPVVLVCTSGSALLNYYPAISEAYYSNIPLVILSADRPGRLLNIGDGQTINQKNVFNKNIGYSENLNQNDNYYLNLFGLRDNNQYKINKALNFSIEKQSPVHINIPFSEPLYEVTNSLSVNTINKLPRLNNQNVKNISSFRNKWQNSIKKIILIGVSSPDLLCKKSIDLLVSDSSLLVLIENTSNVYHPSFCNKIDQLIAPLTNKELKEFRPEILITIGGMIISKKIKAIFRDNKPNEHWHIGIHDANDTFFCLTKHFKTSPNNIIYKLYENFNDNGSDFYNKWDLVISKRKEKHKKYLSNLIYCDFKVFDYVLNSIPSKSMLQVSNSSAIRYTQLFDLDSSINVFCNRGTSGIDGSTSTAVGAASVFKGNTVFITGDLSFFYDSNALWNNFIPTSFRVILINNKGGGIFKILTKDNNTELFKKFFETKHDLYAKDLCNMYDFEYFTSNDEDSLKNILNDFHNESEKPRLLEVITDNDYNQDYLLNYFDYIK